MYVCKEMNESQMIKCYNKTKQNMILNGMKWEPVYQAFLLVPLYQQDLANPAKNANKTLDKS